jgi:hypothetical protein
LLTDNGLRRMSDRPRPHGRIALILAHFMDRLGQTCSPFNYVTTPTGSHHPNPRNAATPTGSHHPNPRNAATPTGSSHLLSTSHFFEVVRFAFEFSDFGTT